MKNIFLDTSALFKLYTDEEFSQEVMDYVRQEDISSLIISEISIVEFSSIVWKKTRDTSSNRLQLSDAYALLQTFDNDLENFFIIELEKNDSYNTRRLLSRCNMENHPLRTLDAFHLYAANKLLDELDELITFDNQMKLAAEFIGFPAVKPPFRSDGLQENSL